MNCERTDLHLHSIYSDGTCTPDQIAELACKEGLRAIVLTDHDTGAGFSSMKAACEKYGLETISGIELSTSWEGKSIHILGYGMDTENPDFKASIEHWQSLRYQRNLIMINRMQADGIDISEDAMKAFSPDAVVTRANMAAYLVEKGVIPDVASGFDYYLSRKGPYYEPVKRITPMEAVAFLKKHHAAVSFAHPILTHMCEMQLDRFTGMLKEAGLDAIEGLYSGYTIPDQKEIRRLAKKYDLIISGGSDFHGSNKPDISIGRGKGDLCVPYEAFQKITELI